MSKLTKITLSLLVINTVATVLFLTGIINVSSVPGFYLSFPLVAICYGLFVIFYALDNEVAKFDAEERAHHDIDALGHPHNVEYLHSHDHHESIAA